MAMKAQLFAGRRSTLTSASHAKQIRILVADDHAVVRKGVVGCLNQHEHLTVVGEAEDGLDAMQKAAELSPDVVLMDIDLPKLNGLSATESLHREKPAMKVLILSAYVLATDAERILKSGAWGYLPKSVSASELVDAIEMIAAGGDYFRSNQRADIHPNRPTQNELKADEREVLVAIAEGLGNKEIAAKLAVEVRTVETRRDRLMRKLNIRNVADLTRFAIIEGLVSLP
jgi:DNA-binding NarL/FixJ family response regulator